LGVKALCVVSAGFGESGVEGKALQDKLRDVCRSSGMRLLGPNCLGVQNPEPSVRMNATFGPRISLDGGIAFASQSGAVGLAAIEFAARLGVGFSAFVSLGNKADISGNDLLEYFENDPRTKVILLYLESLGNPVRFRELATRISAKKPIAIVKAGRSAAGARAAFSHTGAMSSRDDAVAALCLQSGIIRARTIEELFDVGRLLASEPLPKGNRVAVVTNAGGMGILAADACEATGLLLPRLEDDIATTLRSKLRPEASVTNPVDVLADAAAPVFTGCVDTVLKDEDVDAVLALHVLTTGCDPNELPPMVEAVARRYARPVLGCWMGRTGEPPPSDRVPRFSFPENAALALARAAEYSAFRQAPPMLPPPIPTPPTGATRVLADARARLGAEGGWLDAKERLAFADAWGLAMAKERFAKPSIEEVLAAANALGFPLVLKAELAGVTHKSEHGAVAVELNTIEEVRSHALRMLRLEPVAFELQQFVTGEEWLVGAVRDPVFGPLVTVGAGGSRAELWRDIHSRLAPLNAQDVEALMRTPRIGRTLLGFRSDPPGDQDALAQFISRFAAAAAAHSELAELEVNPLKVRRPGEGVAAVDVRIRLRRS
jgi:acyl-CoA synthetase (NDP forming)